MDDALRLNINIFAALVAVILLIGSRGRGERPYLDRHLFALMLWTTLAELALDSLTWLLDGSAGPASRAALEAASFLYYLLHPATAMLYAMYAAGQAASDTRALRRRLPLIAAPALLSALLSVASIFTGWYFSVDASGSYARGTLFPVFVAASYSYFVLALYIVVSRRKQLDRATFASLVAFPLPPAIAGALQSAFFGIVVVWPSMVLSLLILYASIQERRLAIDYLTGAYNRRRLDEYLSMRVRELVELRPPRPLAGFLADIDDFKEINDRLGHAAGDDALVEAVRIMRSCLRTDDFLARYAGDEFVGILSLADAGELGRLVERLRGGFEGAGEAVGRFRLSISVGAAVFDPALDADGDRFVERLDALMYAEKEAKKAEKSRRRT